jgi:murein DD-endopeptidase MepM/ murein hydrolase activator NlpD
VRRLRSVLRFAGERATRLPVRAGFAQLVRRLRAGSGDGPLWNRYALHLVIVCLAVGVVGTGRVSIPQIELLLPTATLGADVGGAVVADEPSNRGLLRPVSEEVGLLPAPVPHTTIPERARTEVITYTVQTNDNMWSIAQSFGLQVETLLWANPPVEQNPDLLSVNQVLNVPPVDGVYYTVKKGDTLAKLAKTYKTTVAKISGLASNGLQEPFELVAGQKIVLVGGQKPAPPAPVIYPLTHVASAPKGAPKGTGRFAWPTRGQLSCPFGRGHTGIDIANRIGTPVLAADDGYVVLAGRDTYGYGIQIVIDHGNGFWTRYAHLSKLYVTAGDIVKKNQRIADMGNTGHTTGPHLHFEVIKDGTQRNPLTYLP